MISFFFSWNIILITNVNETLRLQFRISFLSFASETLIHFLKSTVIVASSNAIILRRFSTFSKSTVEISY